MKIKNKILIPIIILLIFFYLLIAYNEFSKYIKDKENSLISSNSNKFNLIMKYQDSILETIGINLTNSSIVKRSYLENNPKIIADEFSKTWKDLKEIGTVSEIHFFKNPTISFINFSNLLSKNSDLSKVRTDINWASDSCQRSSHIFACRKYIGFRHIHPILNDNGDILGSLSVGRDLNVIPEYFRKLEDKEAVAVYYKKNISNLEQPILENKINHNLQIDEHIYLNSESNHLNREFFEKIELKTEYQTISFNGDIYFVNIFDIEDFGKKRLGYIVVIDNLTEEYSNFIYKVLINIGFLTALIFLIYIVLNKNLEKINKKIFELSKFANKLQDRNFTVLNSTNFNTKSNNELDILFYNLHKMGFSLQELYENQKNKIDESSLELKNMVYLDSLTGLPNRKAIEKDLKYEKSFSILVFDIDNFSQVNNFFGTNIGNIVLINIAKYLKKIVEDFSNSGMKVYRIGSDEFGVIYRENEKSVEDFILEMIEKSSGIRIFNLPDDIDLEVDLSIGISKNSEASVENSDIALNRAKEYKRPYYIYDDDFISLRKEQERNINLLSTIKQGILEDKFTVFFQPIFNSKREIVKYESLVRLFDGNNYLTPYHFLPYAKKTKYYFEITKIVIEKSFQTFKNRDSKFSINLSVNDIANKNITNFIENAIQNFPKPENITFELLESEQIENFNEIKNFIKRVRKYGVEIAIDDFGSGYSNFSYLVKLKPDVLKIDGSLIKGIATDENSYLITKLIVEFSHKIGFSVVAEFVDSEEILNKGIELGIDSFQGYYLAKPSKDI